MKVIAISGSPRQDGNTDRLLKRALDGARDNGHETVFYRVEDMDIHPCRGCTACFGKGACVNMDDMTQVYKDIREADHVILGAPIYMMGMSAQLKTLIDRFMCFFNPDMTSRLSKNARASMIFSFGSAPQEMVQNYVESVFNLMEMFGFQKWELLLSGGNYPPNAVEGKPDVMDRAYRLGHSV
jgi:multimeric flavodoxin WrbA